MIEGQKVVTAFEMARIERLSIQEGASSESYMECAGNNIGIYLHETHAQEVTLLIGKGNNGGDAYVAGIYLLERQIPVKAYQIFAPEECSPLSKQYKKQFIASGGDVQRLSTAEQLILTDKTVILDGLLGTGFEGEVTGLLKEVILKVNQAKKNCIAIDIPSGLNGNTGKIGGCGIKATKTLYLGLPKLGFFIQDGMNHIGELIPIDFGMNLEYTHQAKSTFHLINEKALSDLLPPINKTRHKYQAGYVLALAGSPGMPGAALLSSLAALRMGAGIIRLFYPEEMECELANAPYELIKSKWDPDHIKEESKRASAMLIGPGLGREERVGLKELFKQTRLPCIVDADGIYQLAEEIDGTDRQIVLTPQHKEALFLLKLDKMPGDELEFLTLCQDYADKKNITLVIKGAPTFIFHPKTSPLISVRGNPGMATAGTGDVLTGLIAALLSQGLQAREAAILGVVLHGIAGELAAEKLTSYDMIASDLLTALPDAIKSL